MSHPPSQPAHSWLSNAGALSDTMPLLREPPPSPHLPGWVPRRTGGSCPRVTGEGAGMDTSDDIPSGLVAWLARIRRGESTLRD